jgi:hypothetical protein
MGHSTSIDHSELRCECAVSPRDAPISARQLLGLAPVPCQRVLQAEAAVPRWLGAEPIASLRPRSGPQVGHSTSMATASSATNVLCPRATLSPLQCALSPRDAARPSHHHECAASLRPPPPAVCTVPARRRSTSSPPRMCSVPAPPTRATPPTRGAKVIENPQPQQFGHSNELVDDLQ